VLPDKIVWLRIWERLVSADWKVAPEKRLVGAGSDRPGKGQFANARVVKGREDAKKYIVEKCLETILT